MGVIRNHRPVKLFVSLITVRLELFSRVEDGLSGLFGPIDLRSDQFPFDSTHYYDKEMGAPLQRCFFSFTDLTDPLRIGEAKIATNEIEIQLAQEQHAVPRPVNLDPGYMEESKIVLASTKNFYHRIMVSRGIYAEVTMHFEGGNWRCLPWTFPDFRTGRYHPFFTGMRQLYRRQLKTMEHESGPLQ
jgi:hypothetical protein